MNDVDGWLLSSGLEVSFNDDDWEWYSAFAMEAGRVINEEEWLLLHDDMTDDDSTREFIFQVGIDCTISMWRDESDDVEDEEMMP